MKPQEGLRGFLFNRESMEQNKEKQSDWGLDDEAQRNLLGLFSLLLEVDKRVNPHLYKKKKRNSVK